MTKKYKTLYILFKIMSILIIFVPLTIYIIKGFTIAQPTQKFILSAALIICIILTGINILLKMNIRSTLWVLVLGIYFCLESIQDLLLCIAISTILDEFIFTPLYKNYKSKYSINKEIDKRL